MTPVSGKGADRGLRLVALIAAVGLYVVVAMGVLVSDSHSQLGCGHDWPLCNGRFLPGPALKTLVEFSHRSVAALVGLFVVAAAVWAWRRYGDHAEVRWLSILAVGFVVVEGLLGAAAVLWNEQPAILALHFGFSLTSMGAMLLLAVVVGQLASGGRARAPAPLDAGVLWLAWGALAYVYGLVYLGAYVSFRQAGLGCLGWPLCNGAIIPNLHGATLIVFGHRVAAMVFLLLLIWTRVRVGRCPGRPDLVHGANLALACALLQIASGALLILTRLNTMALFLHGTLVSLLFGAIVYLCFQTLPPGPVRSPTTARLH